MLETLTAIDTYYPMIAAAGLLTGLAYSIGGSGGLIVTPMLIALGMPIHTAIGSAKLGSIVMLLTVFLKFKKSSDYIQSHHILSLTSIAVIGASIGASITLSLEKDTIYPLVGFFLVALSPLALIKKQFGLESYIPSRKQKIMGYSSFAFVMIFGGFFGAGAGIPGILALVSFLGFTVLQAHSTLAIPFLAVNLTGAALFAINGYVDYIAALILTLTMTLGGYIGTKIVLGNSEKLVKYATCAFAFLFGLKMIYESFVS